MKRLILILSVLIFASCGTAKKASEQHQSQVKAGCQQWETKCKISVQEYVYMCINGGSVTYYHGTQYGVEQVTPLAADALCFNQIASLPEFEDGLAYQAEPVIHCWNDNNAVIETSIGTYRYRSNGGVWKSALTWNSAVQEAYSNCLQENQ